MWQCANQLELHVFPHGSHGGAGLGSPDVRSGRRSLQILKTPPASGVQSLKSRERRRYNYLDCSMISVKGNSYESETRTGKAVLNLRPEITLRWSSEPRATKVWTISQLRKETGLVTLDPGFVNNATVAVNHLY